MDRITVLGLFAGTLTTISFIPQVVKAWKSHSTKDVSFWMFLLLTVGVMMWVVYGFLIGSLPVIMTNAVTLVLVFILLVLKIKYK
ncbi:MAG: SemiSWEET transporter [Deltaproteobacteria bacterium]|nr:SemiSWEET transporter [Deltaproteobacteria bacterium]